MLMVSSSSFLLSQSILESGVCALNLVSPIIIKGKSCNRLVSPSSSLLLCSASPSTSSQKNQSSSSSSSSWTPSSELSFESSSTLLPDHDEEELLTGWSYIPSQTSHTGSVRKEEETNQRVENSIPKLSDILTSLDTNEKNPKKSGKDVFFDNNKNKKASLCDEKRIPWKADFVTSRKTQAKLKKIMIVNNSEAVATADPSFSHHHQEQKKLNNLSNCVQIFKTLLKDTPSYMCNEVNLLYALTVTAKLYPSSLEGEKSKRNESSQETTRLRNEFKSLLIESLETLSNIISSGSQHELSLRQYANAAWAIVRHQVKNSALDFHNDEDNEDSARNRAATTVEDLLKNIERKIVHELLHNNNNRGEEKKKSPKPAELCMISSAYASKEPRDCPVGWRTVSGYQTNFPISSSSDISYSVMKFDDNAGISISEQDVAEESISSTLVDQPNMSKTSSTNSLFEIIAKTILDSKQNTPDGDENKLVEYELLRQSSWKELSNLAWSFATHDFINPTEPKPLSNNVYSFIEALATEATERLSSSSSVHDVSSSAMQPRDLSLLAWSLGMLQVVDFRLGDSYVNYINALETHLFSSSSHPFARWNCTDLIQLAVSLAHGRLDNQKILLALYDEALHKIFASEENMEHKKKKKDDTFESWELSVLVWVQAKLYLTGAIDETYETFSNHVPTVIMERLQSSSDLSQIGIGPKEQANLAWSLAVLQTYQHPDSIRLLQSIFDQPFSIADGEQWPEHLHQLHQALFVLSDECPEATKYVKNEYREYLLENWINEKSRIKTSSARHKALSQTLSLMRVAHYNEHDEDIDVAIVLKDSSSPTSSARSSLQKGRNKEVKPKWTHMATTTSDKSSNSKGQDCHDESNVSHKVAVEFDGPNHFTRIIQDEESSQHNTTPKPNNGSNSPRVLGHTVLKYRMLKIKGWTVVRVPFYEFDKIPFWASMERQRYLQRALKTHANIKFSEVDISEYKPHVVHSRKSRFD